MSDEKKEMTVREAGRLGGTKVVKLYGAGHMAEIGRKGGKASPSKFEPGATRTRLSASRGGRVSPGNFANSSARAAEAGRKGGLQRALNAREREDVEPDGPKAA